MIYIWQQGSVYQSAWDFQIWWGIWGKASGRCWGACYFLSYLHSLQIQEVLSLKKNFLVCGIEANLNRVQAAAERIPVWQLPVDSTSPR